MIRQAVILCGGLGTRLGSLTHATPKPLLPVGGRPFLEILIGEVVRQGFNDIVLLSGFCSDQVVRLVKESRFIASLKANIRVIVEPVPAGTGGALRYAEDILASEFILMNGDSLFDIPLRRLCLELQRSPALAGVLALREVAQPDRFGVVEVVDGVVQDFADRAPGRSSGLINGGIYAMRRDAVLQLIGDICSLERDIFPALVAERRIGARAYDGFFLDIGIPDSYSEAQESIPALIRRPAIFFDRDGVLNVDHGYVGTMERFDWIAGARSAVRSANDAGYLVFVVTNQAGVARGLYPETAVADLFDHMQMELAEIGAHIDDYRYCPHHSDGTIEQYRKACDWRKPAPGMIVDLAEQWSVDMSGSVLIGDKQSDLDAAKAAGIDAHYFAGGALDTLVHRLLEISTERGLV